MKSQSTFRGFWCWPGEDIWTWCLSSSTCAASASGSAGASTARGDGLGGCRAQLLLELQPRFMSRLSVGCHRFSPKLKNKKPKPALLMVTQIRKHENAQHAVLCFAALDFLVLGQDSCALLRSIAQHFWEIPRKYPRPSFWTNGIEKMILVQLLECVLGKARSMWNSVQTILVFGEYRKYTEY